MYGIDHLEPGIEVRYKNTGTKYTIQYVNDGLVYISPSDKSSRTGYNERYSVSQFLKLFDIQEGNDDLGVVEF
jgi:hypothetical protein